MANVHCLRLYSHYSIFVTTVAMNRLIIILLCLCSVVVCAFIAYLGYQQQSEDEVLKDSPPPIACDELLHEVPHGLSGLTLTEFRPGKHFVTDDKNNDGEWERVLIPVFPIDTKSLKPNYRSIILSIADAKDKEELFDKVESPEIEAEYWFSAQKLDPSSYSRMAEKYTSMDFNHSVVLHCGYPKSNNIGSFMLWGASAGALLSLLILGWQSTGLILAGIKNEAQRAAAADEEDDYDVVAETKNRAGLPEDLDEI